MTDTKTALLDCAEELIQRVGVNAMSYKHLSDEIGIRKASIHYHFPKKEDMVVALLCRCRDVHCEMYRTIANSDDTARNKILAIADLYASSLEAGKVCAVGMLSVEFESLGEAAQEATRLSIDAASKIFETIFVQAINEGLIPKTTNAYDAAYGFFCFLLGTQVLSRCTNGADGFRRAVDAYIQTLTKN